MNEAKPGAQTSKAPWWSLFAFWLIASCSSAGDELPGAAAIASAHPLATAAGQEILQAGGNAFDAAVAISAALAVVEPYSSGIGGGGFWLLHRQRDGFQVMVDGRETAPGAATADLYLNDKGDVVPRASIDGPKAAGIPGVAAALVHISDRYGRLPLTRTLAPAVRLASDGFEIDAVYRRMAAFRLKTLQGYAAASQQFLLDGEVPPEGYRLRQPALAETLRSIARDGAHSFYHGDIARRLVDAVRANGGIWSQDDLANYRVVERQPIQIDYRGFRITSAALPSSGGVVLKQMLQMLDVLPLQTAEPVDRIHLLVEVMRRAYADRARYLGDSDFVDVPLQRLTDPDYDHRRAASIDPRLATPSETLTEETLEGTDTTHFSVLDAEGNRVAATLSVNYPFGSCFVAADTGVLLNDEMDDFSAKPGAGNAYGLTGNAANAIAPGKRMLSSMSPTFAENNDSVLIIGTPGGSRIISMVLLGLLREFDGGSAADIVATGRFHHQYLPDRIEVEPDVFSDEMIDRLTERGYSVRRLERTYGNMQVVLWDRRSGRVEAAADPRGIGSGVTIRRGDRVPEQARSARAAAQ